MSNNSGTIYIYIYIYDLRLEPEDKVLIYGVRGRGCRVGEYPPARCNV